MKRGKKFLKRNKKKNYLYFKKYSLDRDKKNRFVFTRVRLYSK